MPAGKPLYSLACNEQRADTKTGLSSSIWWRRSFLSCDDSRSYTLDRSRFGACYYLRPCYLSSGRWRICGPYFCWCRRIRRRRRWWDQDSYDHCRSHSRCFEVRYVLSLYHCDRKTMLTQVVPFAIKAEQGDTLEYIWGGGPVSLITP
jgi:hypothetical protein